MLLLLRSRPDFSTFRNVLRVPGSSGPSTAADAEGDNDPEQSYGSSIVVLALGQFPFSLLLGPGFHRGERELSPTSLGSWCQQTKVGGGGGGSWCWAQPFFWMSAFIRTREWVRLGFAHLGVYWVYANM